MDHPQVLPRSTPELQGIPSGVIGSFLDRIQEQGVEMHSFMAMRSGHVIAEGWWAPYREDLPHMMFSLSKSFTSTAVGLAIEEGLLKLDDKVISFFPEETPETVSEHLAAMSVRHLLTMSCGHHQDQMDTITGDPDGNWVRAFLHAAVEHEPGSHFAYNSGATYIAGVILQKLTGETLIGYLQPRIFEPLGITDAAWEKCPMGYDCGGWGLSVTTEAVAKFGQLYLQQGMWQGKQLIPSSWITEATSKQISNGDDPNNDWNQGYGYQFWRCRHGVYRGDGAFGQFCIVMPEQDTVLAVTGATGRMDAVLNAVWDVLLPAFRQPAEPIAPDPAGTEALRSRLDALALEPPGYAPESPLAEKWSGITYQLEDNILGLQTFSFETAGSRITETVRNATGEHVLVHGTDGWAESGTSLLRGSHERVAASAGWESENTLMLTQQFIETPFRMTTAVTFKDNVMELSFRQNVGADEALIIHGTALAGAKEL